MEKSYRIEVLDGYVRVTNTGAFQITPDAVRAQFDDLAEVCRQSGCHAVLITGPKPIREMKEMDAFDSGTYFADQGLYGLRIAYCLTDYRPDDLTRFFENVSNNRSTQIAFFPTCEEGLKWLAVKPGTA